MRSPCFDNARYIDAQVKEILGRMRRTADGATTYVEFGGKAFDDRHAARVLPGYDPDLKLHLLRELAGHFEIVVVVSARDILHPRIRGDTRLFYDRETIRLVKRLRLAGIPVRHGVVSMVRSDYAHDERMRLDRFIRDAASTLKMTFVEHGYVPGYPDVQLIGRPETFRTSPKIDVGSRNLLVFSPGGGSGKFGVILSQLWHDFLISGTNFPRPSFVGWGNPTSTDGPTRPFYSLPNTSFLLQELSPRGPRTNLYQAWLQGREWW